MFALHFFLNIVSLIVITPQLSHRSAMAHMDEVPFNSEEYGTYNRSFSFPDKAGLYTQQDPPPFQGPVPPRTTAATDASYVPAESVCSPVVFNNNVSAPTKSPCSPPTFHPATVDQSPTHRSQDAASPKEELDAPRPTSMDPIETLPNTSPNPETDDGTTSPPLTCPDSQSITNNDDSADPPASPSSQSSAPISHTRIASAEIDKPFCKPRVKTPPHSPPQSSPLSKEANPPPSTPEHPPVKAKLVHIDASPLNTPPITPARTSVTLSTELDQPSTSLDQADQSGSPSKDRRPSMNSGDTQDGHKVGGEDDQGVVAIRGADKDSDSELEPDEEELLRVLARCNPIFITFSK